MIYNIAMNKKDIEKYKDEEEIRKRVCKYSLLNRIAGTRTVDNNINRLLKLEKYDVNIRGNLMCELMLNVFEEMDRMFLDYSTGKGRRNSFFIYCRDAAGEFHFEEFTDKSGIVNDRAKYEEYLSYYLENEKYFYAIKFTSSIKELQEHGFDVSNLSKTNKKMCDMLFKLNDDCAFVDKKIKATNFGFNRDYGYDEFYPKENNSLRNYITHKLNFFTKDVAELFKKECVDTKEM